MRERREMLMRKTCNNWNEGELSDGIGGVIEGKKVEKLCFLVVRLRLGL